MVDYSKGLWQAAKVYEIISNHPETMILKSSRRKIPQLFCVNKALLCHYSAFFEKAFSRSWKESHEWKVEFEVDVPQRVLRLFHGWLSTGRVFTRANPDHIFELYKYADYINCLALRRAIITHARTFSTKYSGCLSLFTYKSLRDSKIWTDHRTSALYKWIVDTFAFHWDTSWDEEDDSDSDDDCSDDFDISNDIPGSFLCDQRRVAYEFRREIKKGIPAGECRCCKSACTYHEHSSEAERRATCGGEEQVLDLAIEFEDEDTDDIDDSGEEAVDGQGNQDVDAGTEGRSKDFENSRVVNESINTGDNIEGTETDVNGKRKAQDDVEEEEVSTKKHKQEEVDDP